jgi:hypothetical protein
MALSVDQLNAITEKFFIKKLHDNIFDSNPLLKKIMDGGSYKSVSGGTSIYVPLNYAQTTAAGWYQGADTLSTTDNDNITAANYAWCSLYAGVSITEEDELKNAGDAEQLNLLKSKMQIAEKTLKDSLGTGIYSDGSTAKSIVGLRDIVATDQTVGGISQSDNSWWQGQVDSSTTTTTISALNTIYQRCSIDSEKPDFLVGTRSVYNFYYALLQPQQRFQDESTAKGGFQNLMFNGAPMVHDSHVPSSHLFMLNLSNLHLFYHPKRNMSFEPFQKPINQQVKVSRILWMGAFGSSNNRLHGKLSALAA